MKFPTVEKFLCCIRLELGIFTCAWIYLLWSTLSLIILALTFTWLIVDYFSLIDLIPDSYFADLIKSYTPTVVKFIFILLMAYCALYIYASRKIMISIKTRIPGNTLTFIILTFISSILSLLSILHLTLGAILSGVIFAIIEGYICFCSYSFYDILKQESVRTQNRRSQYASSVQYYSHVPSHAPSNPNPLSFKFQV